MSVTGPALADALVAHGLDPAERAAKAGLFASVLDAWHSTVGGTPPHLWWVPGRLEVFGKHTDYGGGKALVAAVTRGFAVAAAARDDGAIRVIDARRTDTLILSPGRDPVRLPGWRHYVDVVARRLAANFPGQSFGADVVLASDLPSAAGMSSSSALVIAIAEALGRIGGIQRTPEWKLNIRGPLDVAGYYACLENGRSFGGLRGSGGVGTHGGSEDHSAIVNGRPHHVLAFAFVPSRARGSARVPDDWQFVIATSGVAANKTGRAQDAYNQLSADAEALLQLWNDGSAARPRAVSLAAALATPGAAEWLRGAAGRLTNRLEHFIREDARVPLAIDAFGRADAAAVGELAAASQEEAETLLGNQVAETVALAEAARRAGAFAASSFGAGFGGAVWALVEKGAAAAFASEWGHDAFAVAAGPPLTDLSTK